MEFVSSEGVIRSLQHNMMMECGQFEKEREMLKAVVDRIKLQRAEVK